MTTTELTNVIQAAAADVLRTGNSAPKLYLRVRPTGAVDVHTETSWCVSPDEYYQHVPHDLSLEILESSRNYSSLSEADIAECADAADDAAWELVDGWKHEIEEWVAAGNLLPSV